MWPLLVRLTYLGSGNTGGFGGTTNTGSTGLFGQTNTAQQPAASTSLFGQSQPASNAFGGGAFGEQDHRPCFVLTHFCRCEYCRPEAIHIWADHPTTAPCWRLWFVWISTAAAAAATTTTTTTESPRSTKCYGSIWKPTGVRTDEYNTAPTGWM